MPLPLHVLQGSLDIVLVPWQWRHVWRNTNGPLEMVSTPGNDKINEGNVMRRCSRNFEIREDSKCSKRALNDKRNNIRTNNMRTNVPDPLQWLHFIGRELGSIRFPPHRPQVSLNNGKKLFLICQTTNMQSNTNSQFSTTTHIINKFDGFPDSSGGFDERERNADLSQRSIFVSISRLTVFGTLFEIVIVIILGKFRIFSKDAFEKILRFHVGTTERSTKAATITWEERADIQEYRNGKQTPDR